MKTNIGIGHINVCSLAGKTHDVLDFMSQHKLSIVGVTETRLTTDDDDTSLVDIPLYVYHARRAQQRLHTGIGVYVHDTLKHCIHRRLDLEPHNIECIWLEVRPHAKKKTLVGFLYRNGKSSDDWYENFHDMMIKINSLSCHTVLLGDFNINLLAPQLEWTASVQTLGLKQMITEPTRIQKYSSAKKKKTWITSTLIDHIYTNTEMISSASTSNVSISDHKPIICKLSCKVPKTNCQGHTYVQYRCFKKFDSTAFFADISRIDFNQVSNCIDAQAAWSLWSTLFLLVVNKHIPLKKKRVKHTNIPNWLTSEIQCAMRVRDRLKKNKQFDEYKRERNKVTKLVIKAKKAYFEKLVSNENNISQVWKALNVLSNKSQRNKSHSHNFSSENLNTHFISAIQELKNSSHFPSTLGNTQPQGKLTEFCRTRLRASDSFSIPLLSTHEVGRLMMDLSNKKTLDVNHLNAKIIKLSLPYICESLTYLYNRCIQENVFPCIFKEAKVIPIPKSKDLTNMDNFRPISILPVLSKPLEKHIHCHLLKYVEDRDLFHKFQSGFRPHHSCSTALIRMCDAWSKSIDEQKVVGAVFLDLRKAFDMVDHDILTQKLRIYFQDNTSARFFQSYMSNRSQRTYVNGSLSSSRDVSSGVPQGSILGPLLFGLYINDLPLHLRHKSVDLDLFADDSSLSTCGKNLQDYQNILQDSVNDVHEWCTLNRMALNPSKSKCMVITSRQMHQRHPLDLSLQLNGKTIQQVREHRLLGVKIDDQLNWVAHINFIQKRLSKNIYLLSRLWHFVSLSALKTFFYAHCYSHVNYASPVWCKAESVHIKKLDRLLRRGIRIMHRDQSMTTEEKYRYLDIKPLANQFNCNVSVLMFKQYLGLAPLYIRKLFPDVRNARTLNYKLPVARLKNLTNQRFAVQGVAVWNSLPLFCKNCTSLRSFKRSLRLYFS